MRLIQTPTSLESIFNDSTIIDDQYVKAVVDIGKERIACDAGMHVDLEQFLLEEGSKQSDLWGINFLKGVAGDDWIEFDSMINIRPAQKNRSRGVDDVAIQKKIREIVGKLIT